MQFPHRLMFARLANIYLRRPSVCLVAAQPHDDLNNTTGITITYYYYSFCTPVIYPYLYSLYDIYIYIFLKIMLGWVLAGAASKVYDTAGSCQYNTGSWAETAHGEATRHRPPAGW